MTIISVEILRCNVKDQREKMIAKILMLALSTCVNCEWVKLPQMSNTPKVNYKIQTVASFSDLSPSSILANSDVLSSVFSYDAPKTVSSTTEMTLITEASFSQQSKMKKYFPSTVTSKTVDFKPQISDRVDLELMEPVKLTIGSNQRKVIFLNQTVPIKVQSPYIESGKVMPSNQDSAEENEDDDDDGVTVVNEDESLDNSEELASSEEEYEYEYEAEIPLTSTTTTTTTTTTKAPRKVTPSKPQRRVIQVASMKAKPHNHLSFTSFLKFLKNIQESFATRTAKNINDKISMLRKFRDKLLITVNQRINSLWKTQSKKKTKKNRNKRTLGGGGGWMEGGGGAAMDFPSAEGALLSISFLTFAVFLIKLVLVSFFS